MSHLMPMRRIYLNWKCIFQFRYPGKLCALCNLSERSTLGQGDIIKLKLSEDLDFSTLEDKRKLSGSESPSGSHGGISASPKSLNSRRKNRKITSGEIISIMI